MRSKFWVTISLLLLASPTVASTIIQSVTLSKSTLTGGGQFSLTVVAESDYPVNWLYLSYDAPSGNLQGGGRGVRFTKTGDREYTYSQSLKISNWAPSGIYKFTNIWVQNEAHEESGVYPRQVEIAVENSEIAETPVIRTVTASPAYLKSGGKITLEILAESNAPISWISRSFDSPNGNILGGGSSVKFRDLGNHLWHYSVTHRLSPWAPSGTYSFSSIFVGNEGQLNSEIYPPVRVYLKNSNVAQKPVITSATLSARTIPAVGGSFELTITALSNAPVNWINKNFDGPTGNITGGGAGATFNEISPGEWQAIVRFNLSATSPPGVYVISHLSVANEGQLTSDEVRPVKVVKN